MTPKPEKSEFGSISWKHDTEALHSKNISGPYQLFYGLGPIFFCSVNGALACRRLLVLSLHRIFLSVSNSKILIFLENAGFLCERKENLKKYRCYKIYSYRQTQNLKINVNHSVESESDWTYHISENENYPATSDATKAGSKKTKIGS